MKNIYLLLIALLLTGSSFGQVVLTEGFESATIPTGWTNQNVSGTTVNWGYQAGGSGFGATITTAQSGSRNAILYKSSATATKTRLVSPALNLSGLTSPTLKFWHAQEQWVSDQDELRIYYRTSATGTWTLIPGQVYTANIDTWTERTIVLPNPSATYYIGFEGTAKYGHGVLLDNVSVAGSGPTNVNCAGAGLNDGFCYGNSQTITKSYAASVATNQLSITFTAGTLEANGSGTYDDLIIYDGTNASAPVLYNSDINGNTINGRTFVATSGKLFLSLVSDFSISCASGEQTALAYTLSCIAACTPPSQQATNYSTSNINSPSVGNATLNWTRGNGNNVLVVMKAGAAVDASPINGTSYTANAAFGSGTEIGTGNFVVYKGPAALANVTGLSINTTYHVAVYEFNNAGPCYSTSPLRGNFTVPCTTPLNVTALTATPGFQQATLNWTNSTCFDEVLVVAKANSAVTAVPTGDGSAYTANSAFAAGTQIAANEYVVYKGTGSTVNVTALTNNTTYHFRVYTRKGSVWSSGVAANATPSIIYCTATATNTSDEWLSNVQLNTINNASGSTGYSNFTGISTPLFKGAQYTITLTPAWGSTTYSETYAVWIDYNQNGDFTDPGEQVFTQAATTSPVVSGNFTVPVAATEGPTRMRVIMKFSSLPTSPCGSFTYGEVEDYTVDIQPPVTYVYNNGWSPSDPNGVSTIFNDIAIVNGAAVISATTSANSVSVSSTGALTVDAGSTLSVTNSINMESTSVNFSSLILNGTINGTVIYTRHVNGQPGIGVGSGGNDLISAPVTGETFSAFASNNPNLRANTNAGLETQRLFGIFSKVTGTYEIWDVVAQANNVLNPGVGYRAATTDNAGLIFTGTVNKDIVTNNILNSGPQFAAYNLIGNPYPSYLNVFDFLRYDVDAGAGIVTNMDLMNTYGAIYGYDGDASGVGGSGWTTYNLTTPGSVNLAPGQGFLVTADASKVAAYDMTFAPEMRRIDTTDDFIPGRMANDNHAQLKLQANMGTAVFKTDIFFIEGTTSGLDFGYDAAVFGSNAASKALYSQLVENNTGVDLSIQSLAFDALGSDISVPLGINAPQGQQVSVSIAETTLPANIDVYLEDNVAGTFTLLNNSEYVFTANSNLSETGRFFLRFTDQTLSNQEVNIHGLQIFTTTTPRALFVKGQLATATTVSLYDIQGRMVLSTLLDTASNSNQVDVSSLSSGVYVVKLNNNTQQKTQKVILK